MTSPARLHSTDEVRLILGRILAPKMVEEVCAMLEAGKLDAETVRPKVAEEKRAEMRTRARAIARRSR